MRSIASARPILKRAHSISQKIGRQLFYYYYYSVELLFFFFFADSECSITVDYYTIILHVIEIASLACGRLGFLWFCGGEKNIFFFKWRRKRKIKGLVLLYTGKCYIKKYHEIYYFLRNILKIIYLFICKVNAECTVALEGGEERRGEEEFWSGVHVRVREMGVDVVTICPLTWEGRCMWPSFLFFL